MFIQPMLQPVLQPILQPVFQPVLQPMFQPIMQPVVLQMCNEPMYVVSNVQQNVQQKPQKPKKVEEMNSEERVQHFMNILPEIEEKEDVPEFIHIQNLTNTEPSTAPVDLKPWPIDPEPWPIVSKPLSIENRKPLISVRKNLFYNQKVHEHVKILKSGNVGVKVIKKCQLVRGLYVNDHDYLRFGVRPSPIKTEPDTKPGYQKVFIPNLPGLKFEVPDTKPVFEPKYYEQKVALKKMCEVCKGFVLVDDLVKHTASHNIRCPICQAKMKYGSYAEHSKIHGYGQVKVAKCERN